MATDLATATTDSEGKAILKTNLSSAGTQTFNVVETSTNQQTSVSCEVINVTEIELQTDSEYVLAGMDTTITAYPKSNGEMLRNMLIHIGGEDYVTDNEGKAVHVYNATGQGNILITANTGNFSEDILLHDVVMYYNSSNEVDLGVNYNLESTVSVTRRYNGIEFSTSPTSDGRVVFMPETNTFPANWIFEFDVKSITYAKKTQWKDDMMIDFAYISNDLMKTKPHIRIVHTPNLVKIYLNDTLIHSKTPTLHLPNLVLSLGHILTIDNIIFMKWEEGA